MTKTHRKAGVASSADAAFHRHYAAIWGEERWRDSLYPALLRPTRYACLLNPYTPLAEGLGAIVGESTTQTPLVLPDLPGRRVAGSGNGSLQPVCFIRKPMQSPDREHDLVSNFPPPATSSNGLLSHWNLDAASVIAAHLLDVEPGDNVLDLCAAPGGKSIAIAGKLWPHLHVDDSSVKREAMESKLLQGSTLHSNEADDARHRRLAENLKAYLPKILFDSHQTRALRLDGAKPEAEYELRVRTANGTVGYGKVLVDAPCSSERHIIHAHSRATAAGRVAGEIASWRPGSSKCLVSTQIDLLLTGLRAAEVGGVIIYATCSIDPSENDGVIEKVLAKLEKDRKKRGLKWTVSLGFNQGKGDEALETALEQQWAERTNCGWIVLPDHPAGGQWGPLFFAQLNKVELAP